MSKDFGRKGFTLVELLVVITILAILSVVAYQNFGGAVDKANTSRKVTDVATIQTGLNLYNADNNYFPKAGERTPTNVWGYKADRVAQRSNYIGVRYSGSAISEITAVPDTAALHGGGGRVMGIGTFSARQIGAKGTISRDDMGTKYLTEDLYDPEIGDIKLTTGTLFKDQGFGRYVYATYNKGLGGNWSSNMNGRNFNIAYTIKIDGEDSFKTVITGNYDTAACGNDSALCPTTLIGSGANVLLNDSPQTSYDSTSVNYGVPYAVTGFQAVP